MISGGLLVRLNAAGRQYSEVGIAFSCYESRKELGGRVGLERCDR